MSQELSLTAQFDDQIRFSKALLRMGLDDDEGYVKILQLLESKGEKVKNLELQLKEISVEKENFKRSLGQRDTQLKLVRHALCSERDKVKKYQKEVQFLRGRLESVKRYLEEDHEFIKNRTPERKKLLSALETGVLRSVSEKAETTDDSISELDCDKSEDDLDTSYSPSTPTPAQVVNMNDAFTGDTFIDSPSMLNITMISGDGHDADMTCIKNAEVDEVDATLVDVSRTPLVTDAVSDSNLTKHVRFMSPASSLPTLKRTPSLKSSNSSSSSISSLKRLTPTRRISTIDKSHVMIPKKILSFVRNEKCTVCGHTFGFMAQIQKCTGCGAVSHDSCVRNIPLPCAPVIIPSRKSYRPKVISDYAPPQSPKVPGILIHCLKEIEERGLHTPFLYQRDANESEVIRVKNEILNSKRGVPSLNNRPVEVLAGVVKSFLRDLEEPLVTYTMWRDCISASRQPHEDDRVTACQAVILKLPPANRDTIAYLMTHISTVVSSPLTKVTPMGMSTIFGPLIVGNSMRNLPSSEMSVQRRKQTEVMMTLIQSIHKDFWQSVTRGPQMIEDVDDHHDLTLNRMSQALNHQYSGRRSSIIGGTADCEGRMSPLKTNLLKSPF